jgi:hypothetical protein
MQLTCKIGSVVSGSKRGGKKMRALIKFSIRKRLFIILTALPLVLFLGGTANASKTGRSIPAKAQPSAPCSLPVQHPKKPSNSGNCRSTQPKIKIYFDNLGDTSGCTFDLTITWGDGKKTHIPDYPGGPEGLAFLASHTYTDAGVYMIPITGSVASGGCVFYPGTYEFSYILSRTPYPEGPPVSAKTMLSRGAVWVSAKVPYNQGAYYADTDGTYREDCSGFVSMAWDLDYSLSTTDLASPTVSTKVVKGFKAIEPGDIILRTGKGHHVFLFVKWADSAHTRATVDEETGLTSPTPYAVEKTFSLKTFNGFSIYSYKNAVARSKVPSGEDGAGSAGPGAGL